ncbi:MAG: ATP-binding cassette domain-containing protein [Clostridiales bacterium]|nr:ATP-binding cassette domain-containing protein [Clostridiales bacterium]
MAGLQVDIKKKYGSFQLDVAFQLDQGTLGILGASGCGKSLTLKCIAGIETPDQGRIILHDRVLFDSNRKINLPPQKRKVGYMFQDYALFPHMTVEKNIMAGMGRKPDLSLVKKYIRQFHLEGLEKHEPSWLSGGQKQRVAMARMIAAQPELLLLDEPFSAMDSYLRWELEGQMREFLEQAEKPALLVSHNRDEAYRLCQTVGCINQGKMEIIEPVREFFGNPKTRTSALLSGCKNISSARILDEHHLLAEDWGIIFTIPCVPAHTKAVGIRAHTFMASDKRDRDNTFPIAESRILEDMFEWNISFRLSENSSWMQWKIPKKEWQEEPVEVPEYVTVDVKNIMFLAEDGESMKKDGIIAG